MILAAIFVTIFLFSLGMMIYQIIDRCEGLAFLSGIAVFFTFFFILPTAWNTYNYKSLVIERGAIEQTILYARQNNLDYENAAITKTIIQFNSRIADKKYTNTTWWGDMYIDDRINNIKPIQ